MEEKNLLKFIEKKRLIVNKSYQESFKYLKEKRGSWFLQSWFIIGKSPRVVKIRSTERRYKTFKTNLSVFKDSVIGFKELYLSVFKKEDLFSNNLGGEIFKKKQ